MKNIHVLKQYIYIASDEEIKEGDWFLEKAGRQYPIHWNGVDKLNRHCKKIILTTDQDLIKDGVQAIDDEFLEWFTKNPSREYVNFTSHGNEKGTKDYELIIPKEVPNQTDEKGRSMTYWGGLAEHHQDKRMYSEEELFRIIAAILHTPALRDGSWEDIGEWFEQFKKK